ncbi:hypothetical protein GCM10008943_33270 [Paenochrobactrum glaciei]|uniref:Uncharacterized protein n=1 Tax=Paenochrobactrum glaciei TaxID=486407 RepID=A0ABP3RW17_9HYPH
MVKPSGIEGSITAINLEAFFPHTLHFQLNYRLPHVETNVRTPSIIYNPIFPAKISLKTGSFITITKRMNR